MTPNRLLAVAALVVIFTLLYAGVHLFAPPRIANALGRHGVNDMLVVGIFAAIGYLLVEL